MFIKLKNLFKRKEKVRYPVSITDEEFEGMSKKEKKDFLSNDLNERIMRVEQRVSAKFGDPVHYNKTEYYKSFDENQKKKFNKYLENKKKKKVKNLFLLFIPLLILGFLNQSMTGNVVKDEFEQTTGINFNLILVLIFFILALVLLFLFYKKLRREKKFDWHIGVLDKIIYSK